MSEVRIAPTNDRSVVGVMNEFAFHGDHLWKDGLEDFESVSFRMSSLILGPLHHRAGSPDRELAAVVGSAEPLVITFPGQRTTSDPAPRASKDESVFQLKVTLHDTKPPIWRRVLVDGSATLDQVHEIIQAAFGWHRRPARVPTRRLRWHVGLPGAGRDPRRLRASRAPRAA